jgi:hypothetical protein
LHLASIGEYLMIIDICGNIIKRDKICLYNNCVKGYYISIMGY